MKGSKDFVLALCIALCFVSILVTAVLFVKKIITHNDNAEQSVGTESVVEDVSEATYVPTEESVVDTQEVDSEQELDTELNDNSGQVTSGKSVDELLSDFTVVDDVSPEDKMIDAGLESLSDYAKSVAGIDVAKSMADKMNFPFPVNVYFIGISVDMEPGVNYVSYGIENTDARLILMYSTKEEIQYVPDYFVNQYGSDCSIVYFNNGVPANSDKLYTAMYDANIMYGYFATDYTGGPEAVLKSYETGGTFAVTIEE